MTTYAAHRTSRFDATRIAAVVALLLSTLALGVALTNRHNTTAVNSSGSRATTTVATTAVAATAGNLTRQQAIAHAMRVDAAGSKYASSNVTSPHVSATTTPANPYWSKLTIMDAHTAP
jgi:hypothetical protein